MGRHECSDGKSAKNAKAPDAPDAQAICQDVPPVAVLVPTSPRHGLVLGIGADGEHVVAVGGQGWDLILSSVGDGYTARAGVCKGLRGAWVEGNDVWVAGEYGHIAHSPDRCSTWEKLRATTGGCLFAVLKDDLGNIWTAGDGGWVGRSTNGGKSFRKVSGVKEDIARISPSPLGVLIPTDGGKLYIGSLKGKIVKTAMDAREDLMKATVTPRGTLIAVGLHGAIYRSDDEGASLKKIKSGTRVMLSSVDHLPDGRLVAVGSSGTILVSYDDGLTFKKVKWSNKSTLWCTHPHFDTMIVGGEGGLVVRVGDPAPREAQALPPLSSEEPEAPAEDDEAAPDEDPTWAAPPPSTEQQIWSTPDLPLEVINNVYASPQLRAWLYPRRGGIDTGVRPVPNKKAAWAALRRALWTADRMRMNLHDEPSGIWKFVSSDDGADRAVGQRMLDPKPRKGSAAADLKLLGVVLGAWGSFVSEHDTRAHELAADFLVATVGLGQAIRRCFLAMEKLPYTSPGPFGRLKEVMALSDKNHAAGREAVLAAIEEKFAATKAKKEAGGYVSEDAWADPQWVASFLLPPGPGAGDEEQGLHDNAMRFLTKFGNFGVHACGMAAGDVSTLEAYIEANNGDVRSEFYSPQPRLYLASILERVGGAGLGPVLARMKPSSPWETDAGYNGLWCQLLAHVKHASALQALVDEHHDLPDQGWAVAGLVTAARMDRRRVFAYLKKKKEARLLELVEADLDQPPPHVEPAPAEGQDRPCGYTAPDARFAAGLPTAADIAPEPDVSYEDAELDAIYEASVENEHRCHDGVPLQRLDESQTEAFVALREKWRKPTSIKELALVPAPLHERLMALGFRLGEWDVRDVLPLVLLAGGLSRLPLLVASVEAPTTLEHALEVAAPFGDVNLVPAMAAAFAAKKNKAAARRWIVRHPRHAAAGAVAMLRDDHRDAAAARVARFVAARGAGDLVLEYASAAGVKDAVGDLLDQDPLTSAARKKLKLPAFAAAKKLPKLIKARGKKAATPAEIDEEIARLAFSNADEPHPGVLAARQRYTAKSRAAFAWALFEAWLDTKANAKAQWCLQALGFWGDDQVAGELTALAKKWPGQGAGKRAQWALDALANIGTDLALTNINLLAEKSRFPAFKEAARERMDAMARARALTTDELADRLCPRLEMDEEGGDTLDFGPRQFRISFDEALKPVLRNNEGKVVKALPRPNKKDDKAKAKEATARFRALKATARAAASLQIARLERAMQTRRNIPAAVFSEHFAAHPWMTHLAQRLVWSLAGDAATTFRVVEDGTLAGLDDEPFVLDGGAGVQVIHPLVTTVKTLNAWREIFADYEILQPFDQLDRQVFTATKKEAAASALKRFKGEKVTFGQLRGMERRGWQRWYDVQVDGVALALGRKSHAVLHVEPGWHPSETAADVGEQTVEALQLWGEIKRLGDLDPIQFSELVHDIHHILLGLR